MVIFLSISKVYQVILCLKRPLLKADVNFDHVKVVANSCGLKTTEMINQKDFLKNMGIDTRLLMLLRKAQTAEGKGKKLNDFDLSEMLSG